PNMWPGQCPAPPGPGCACTTTKPPSAIAPAAASANRFLFIVGFICCYKALFAPLKDMTVQAAERLQNSLDSRETFVFRPSRRKGRSHTETRRCLAQATLREKL